MFNNNKIKIAILEISDQNKAVLEFYFTTAGKSLYSKVNETDADAFIIDYDFPGAKEHWAQVSAATNKPAILLSVREKDVPSTIWLAKPLSAQALTAAATQVKELMKSAPVTDASLNNNSTDKPVATEAVEKAVPVEAKVEEKQEAEISVDEFIELADFNAEDESTDVVVNEMAPEETSADLPLLDDVEDLEQTEENQKSVNMLKAGAAIAGAGALANSFDNFDADLIDFNEDSTTEQKQKSSEELSNELAELMIEEQKAENTETQLDESLIDAPTIVDSIDSEKMEEESEVDSLLESLILGEGNKDHEEDVDAKEEAALDLPEIKETDSIDLFDFPNADEIEAEAELEAKSAEQNIKSETVDPLGTVDDSFSFDFNDTSDASSTENEDSNETLDEELLEKPTSEAPQSEIKMKEHEEELSLSLVEEENEDSLLEENFLIHDDKPSDEDVFTETLEVNYKDVVQNKDNDDELLAIDLEEQDKISEKPVKTEVEDTIESDLLDFDLESIEAEQEQTETHSAISPSATEHSEPEISPEDADLNALLAEVEAKGDELEDAINNKESSDDALEDDLDALLASDLTAEDELQSLLNEVRQEADKDIAAQGMPNSSEQREYEATRAEKRWALLCGEHHNIEKQQDVGAISFTLNKQILGVLLDQLDIVKDSDQMFRLKYDDLIIVIDYPHNKIYCNHPITDDEYADFCFKEIGPNDIKIHELDYSEVRLYQQKMVDNIDRTHSIESFIWTTSLLTSRGRLLENTDITKKVGLKTWPNLTRVELIPHAMNIAAVFSKHPGNLQEVAKWLHIDQKYVFAFYNAALSLGMIEFDSSKFKTSAISFDDNKGTNKNAKERGFFGRLLKRLKA